METLYGNPNRGIAFSKFKLARNDLKNKIRSAKCREQSRVAKLAKTNPKQFWAFINRKTKHRDSVPNLAAEIKQDGTRLLTNTNAEKANVLLKYFSSVFIKEEEPLPTSTENKQAGLKEKMPEINTTVQEVKKN